MSTWRNEGMFWATCTLLFVGSVIVTTLWCSAMSGMGGMPMPGHWSLSMAWMPMEGQTWLGLAVSFLAMWTVMMVAMMLPSLVPVLRRCRDAASHVRHQRPGQLTAWVSVGYFSVWVAFGMVVFMLGVGFAALAMQQPIVARAVPVATGVVVVLAGVLQLTVWKAHQLACCRETSKHLPMNIGSAWRFGLRRGLHCSYCCAGLTAVLVVNGVMDLGVMTAVTVAITIERLAPGGRRMAQAIGGIVIVLGMGLIVRGVGWSAFL
jgi:predicted metal-binding membrane protein